MTRHDDTVTTRQMLDHARELAEVTSGRTESDLANDRVLYLAVLQLLQIVGEAANRLSEEFIGAHAAMPWAEIIALRNRLIHGYNDIHSGIIWRVITDDIPTLIASLEEFADEERS